MPAIAHPAAARDTSRGWDDLDAAVLNAFDAASSQSFGDVTGRMPYPVSADVLRDRLSVLTGQGLLTRQAGTQDTSERWNLTGTGRVRLNQTTGRRAAA